jgi:ligand-binding sensor domain-containing protein
MWFGTIDGLNRFDGYNFKTFRNEPSNPKSVGNNSVFSLCASNDGGLWVGTSKGLFKYDPIEQSFKLIPSTLNKWVHSICEDAKGNVWLIQDNSLSSYDQKLNALQTFDQYQFTSVCIDQKNDLWVATSDGFLKKYNAINNSFTSFDVFSKSKQASTKLIKKVYDTKRGSLLIGTQSEGIKLFDTASGTYKDIIIYNPDKTEIFANDFMQYSDNEYWAATEYGIFIYNIDNGKFTSIDAKHKNIYSISDNAINTLWKDKEGGVWAGTRFGGISYYSYPYTSFRKYFSMDDNHSISGNGVHEIIPDKNGNLWIGTEDAGLNKINLRTNTYKHFYA